MTKNEQLLNQNPLDLSDKLAPLTIFPQSIWSSNTTKNQTKTNITSPRTRKHFKQSLKSINFNTNNSPTNINLSSSTDSSTESLCKALLQHENKHLQKFNDKNLNKNYYNFSDSQPIIGSDCAINSSSAFQNIPLMGFQLDSLQAALQQQAVLQAAAVAFTSINPVIFFF